MLRPGDPAPAFRLPAVNREGQVSLDDYGERVFDLTRSDEQALARLQVEGVLEAIDSLTDDQRSVLLLRVLADLPVREVAAIVGNEETAVKALQRRAVAAIKRRLEEQGP